MKIFELEQQIMNCWSVVDDLDLLQGPEAEALKVIYKLKFDKLWETFEDVCAEYHKLNHTKEYNDTIYSEES